MTRRMGFRDDEPVNEGRLTVEDVKPGQHFRWMHPHLANNGGAQFIMKITSDIHIGFNNWRVAKCIYVAEVMEDHCRLHDPLPHDLFLLSAGIDPYSDGSWSTNWLLKV